MPGLRQNTKRLFPLIKYLQTSLLLTTGLAGFMSARCPVLNLGLMSELTLSLFLAISGSTVLNMIFDRDIDARMERTRKRPIPSGCVSLREAWILGCVLSAAGIAWAFKLNLLYGVIVFAGLFFDVAVYTIWLKRRTAWSVVWGGISGGMPILAGRALALGAIDWIGVALMFAVLFWIPTHIMTFNIRHKEDYARAGIPTFSSAYGDQVTRFVIALSSVLAAVSMGSAAYGIQITWGSLRVLAILSIGLFSLAVCSLRQPSWKLNFGLFKYASIYMLGSMLLMSFGAIG
ncbi:MAG: UbiA family prenyltransferase [Anaerolineales bacterium]|nr:UbiA family prenyltransferase [Anaerolineales bacterium]